MKARCAILALALLAGTHGRALGQGVVSFAWPHASPPPVGWLASAPGALPHLWLPGARFLVTPLMPADFSRIPRTRWKTGALVGGALLGAFGAAALVSLSCYDGPCHNQVLAGIGGFVGFGIVGFGLGALIGGQFPMASP